MLTKCLQQARRIAPEQGQISDGIELDEYTDYPEESEQTAEASGAVEEADVGDMLHMLEQAQASDGVEMVDYTDDPEEIQQYIYATGAVGEADVEEMEQLERLDLLLV